MWRTCEMVNLFWHFSAILMIGQNLLTQRNLFSKYNLNTFYFINCLFVVFCILCVKMKICKESVLHDNKRNYFLSYPDHYLNGNFYKNKSFVCEKCVFLPNFIFKLIRPFWDLPKRTRSLIILLSLSLKNV